MGNRSTFGLLLFILLSFLSPTVTSVPLGRRDNSTATGNSTTTGNGTTTTNGTSTTNSTDQKYVFAHHMVGNTHPYTVEDWAEDISLASAHGIDAFALNLGPDSWQPDQVKNAYQAAEQANATFKLFMSFDMTVLPCSSASDAKTLIDYVTTYASNSAQFKYDNKVFVSTFAGENCNFGQGNAAQGWKSQFTDQLTGSNAVYFVPNFFVDPATFNSYTMDGQFNWNSAWPISVTTNEINSLLEQFGSASSSELVTSFSEVVQNVTSSLDSDDQYISALSDKLYMASVSPWFFTHYSAESFNKNFVYLSDQLYVSRWQSLISSRDTIPMVEILTWNDYGESSYIGPIKGAQPDSQAWVDGFEHTAFLDLTSYFATAYKTGSYPAAEDKIYLWARPHTKNATASADSVGKPENCDVLEDAVFAVILSSSDADVTLSTKSSSNTVSVKQGLTQMSLPLQPGDTVSASLSRNNAVVVEVSPGSFTFQDKPETYNFNFFAAMTGGDNSTGERNSTGTGSSTTTGNSTSAGNSVGSSSSTPPSASSSASSSAPSSSNVSTQS